MEVRCRLRGYYRNRFCMLEAVEVVIVELLHGDSDTAIVLDKIIALRAVAQLRDLKLHIRAHATTAFGPRVMHRSDAIP